MAHGALVQARDIFGDTPLHYAAVRGYPRLKKIKKQMGVRTYHDSPTHTTHTQVDRALD